MAQWNSDLFCHFLLAHKVVGFFEQPITLKSGRQSHFYVNWRDVTNDAYLLNQLSEFIVDFISEWPIDIASIYGVPEGATKTAIVTSMTWAKRAKNFAPGSHPIVMGRAVPKSHGSAKDRDFIGVPQSPVLLLEDTATTGGSLLTTLEKLTALNIQVSGVLTLTDRSERRDDGLSVAQAVEKFSHGKIPYRTMATSLNILPRAAREASLNPEIRQHLVAEFDRYGSSPLVL